LNLCLFLLSVRPSILDHYSPILSALPSASAAMGRQSQLYHSIPSAGWSDDDDRALLLFAYRVGLSNLNQACRRPEQRACSPQ
jgi:hypothetical protein